MNKYDILWEIDYYLTKVKGVWYDLKYGIQNIFQWMPIVWRDRDWDQNYLLEVMKFKFGRMSKLHRDHGHLKRSDETAELLHQMQILTDLLIRDEFYDEEISKTLGDPIFNKRKDGLYETNYINENMYRIYKNRSQASYNIHKEYLFKLLNKHLQNLWD